MKSPLRNKNYKLKGSSLINAIFVSLIISVFCGCLVLISHYHNLLNKKLYLEEENISRNNSSFNYFIKNLNSFDYSKEKRIDVFDDKIYSYGTKKKWGFYDILICKTVFNNDTVSKIALVGNKNNSNNNLALYVTDYDKSLKLSGTIKISGNIKIPYGKVETAYINSENSNAIKIEGKQLKSNGRLPKVKNIIELDYDDYERVSIFSINNKVIINGFDKQTKVIDITGLNKLSDITCKGNIILTSNSTIEISNTANLIDIMIVAPKVIINSGFKGNAQIVAKKIVKIESNVLLYYPSSIYITNDTDSVSVHINERSTLIGGIVINSTTSKNSLKRSLTIDENSKIVGTVYCYGKTELKGTIIGSLYTDRLTLKTTSSYYENMLLNATIDRNGLSKEFIEIPLFTNDLDQQNYEIIKEF